MTDISVTKQLGVCLVYFSKTKCDIVSCYLQTKEIKGGCADIVEGLKSVLGDYQLYSNQPKVSIRVDGATQLGTKISQSEAAAANVRVMLELRFVADWPPQRLNSVAPSTQIETIG